MACSSGELPTLAIDVAGVEASMGPAMTRTTAKDVNREQRTSDITML